MCLRSGRCAGLDGSAAGRQLNRGLFLATLLAIYLQRVIHLAIARACYYLEALSFGCELSSKADARVRIFGPLRFAVEVLRRFKIALLLGDEAAIVERECAIRIKRICLEKVLAGSIPVVVIFLEYPADRKHYCLRSGFALAAAMSLTDLPRHARSAATIVGSAERDEAAVR